MEEDNLPTVDQAMACVRVYQMFSNCYRAVYFFRYDQVNRVVYIQAGTEAKNDEIEITVPTTELWDFYQQ